MTPKLNNQAALDFTTLATIQEDGSVCCQNCGSWTTMEDLLRDGKCPLCRTEEQNGKRNVAGNSARKGVV